VRHSGGRVVIETAIHPAVRSSAAGVLVEAAVEAAGEEPIQLWATADETVAAALDAGLAEMRRVVHLIRPLPPAEPARLPGAFTLSRFRPHADVEAFLEVSNAAFAGHPDKGGWTATTVHRRTERSWFDPDGCFLARDQGRVVGICWTKLHPRRAGEIYIIAVHPDAQGRSLATGLALTALWDLHERRGAATAMVYTDEDNSRARGLYRRLGFEMLRVNRCFVSPAATAHR
jgi:mycothiol synthase